MAYIGREPLGGEVILMNSIESQFNGVLTTFNLTRTVSGVTSAFYPVDSQQLLVSLGGVIQRPDPTGDTGFRISFNTIIFAVAPAVGVSCFIISYGNILDIGTPSSGSVTTEKLVDGSVTPVKLSTGGPWWLSNGNVGIGTTNPGVKLEVRADNNEIKSTCSSSNYTQYNAVADSGVACRIGAYATNWGYLGTTTNHPVRFETNSTTALTIDTSQRVGIGTTNPEFNLDIYPSSGSAGVRAYAPTSNAGFFEAAGSNNTVRSRLQSSGTDAWIGTITNHDFWISTNNDRKVTIAAAGNVGIGITNPSSKLDVNGKVSFTPPSSLSTTLDTGFSITNTSTKTYPTTTPFQVTPGLHQDIQIGTSQTILFGAGSGTIRGIYNRLIKNDGTTTNLSGVGVVGISNNIEWSDANLAGNYSGTQNVLTISGTNISGNSTNLTGAGTGVNVTNPSNTSIAIGVSNGVSSNLNLGTYGSTSQTISFTTHTGVISAIQAPHNQVGKNLSIGAVYGFRSFLSFGGNFSGYDGSNCVTTITNLYQFEGTGYLGSSGTGSTTTITNLYGLFLGTPTTHAGTTITNNWGIYQNWGTAKNYFAGNVGIGTTNPTKKLEVAGGEVSFSTNTAGKDTHLFTTNASNDGRYLIKSDTTTKVDIQANGSTYFNGGNVGIGITNPGYKLEVNGSFAATTKSFVIPHPSKPNYQLRYACLEGPENSVYVRGRTQENVIELPDYWVDLVHEDSITVNLTPVGNKRIWLEEINNNKVYINSEDTIDCHYIVFAERKDVEKLVVEIEEN